MKNYIKILLGLTFGFGALSSCSKKLEDMNNNPKNSDNVPASTLFTYGQKKLVDYYTTPSVSINVFRQLSQEWTEAFYVYSSKYVFSAYTPQNNWWTDLYVYVLHNLDDAKGKWVNTGYDTSIVNNDKRITDMLEVYTYHMLTATYGDIPYSKALTDSVPFASYDKSQDIYSDMLNRLDTSIGSLNLSADAMGDADQFYAGDVSKWKKFGATLMMKIAEDLADKDETVSKKYVQKAVAYGLLESNDDNATMAYFSNSTANINPIASNLNINYSTRHDFVPAGLLVDYMNGVNDPRRADYFQLYKDSAYVGGIAGSSNDYSSKSLFTSTLTSPTFPGTILDYAGAQFMMAEAVERGFVSGSAATYYNNGVKASINFWGGSDADASTYLSNASVAYATATGDWRQKIGYQKWIANFNNPFDAWTDIRRLGYPNLDTDSTRPNGTDAGDFPYRLEYPSNESGSNSINWAAGVANLAGGKDVVTAKLFWIK